MVVERNLGITFGLVVRAMGFSKTVTGEFVAAPGRGFAVHGGSRRRPQACDRPNDREREAARRQRSDRDALRLLRDRQGTRRSRRLRRRGGRHAVGMSEPQGAVRTAGRRSLLGDADRERLVALLREHYAAGRLDLDDLRNRSVSCWPPPMPRRPRWPWPTSRPPVSPIRRAPGAAGVPAGGTPRRASPSRAGCRRLSGSAIRPAA